MTYSARVTYDPRLPVRREMRLMTRCGCTRDLLMSHERFPREFAVALAPVFDHAFTKFEDSAMFELFSGEASRRIFDLQKFERDDFVLRGIYFERGKQ